MRLIAALLNELCTAEEPLEEFAELHVSQLLDRWPTARGSLLDEQVLQ